MKAQYDLKPGIGPKVTEDEQVLYPQLITRGTKKLKDIIQDATTNSGLSGAMVQGVITFLETAMAKYLAEGYRVSLGNIGTFSATLTSRKVLTKSEIHAQSIHFNDVRFMANKELLIGVRRRMRLERVEKERAFKTSSSQYTAKERFKLLTDYLKANKYITRRSYSTLTGLLKTKAATELQKWFQEGKIGREGSVPHIVYKLKK